MEKTLEKLKVFFDRPGINKTGICKEAGLTNNYLNRVLRQDSPLTKSMLNKLLPILKKYGYTRNIEY